MTDPRRWRWRDPAAPLAELVARGGVLAIPTESSYGLAADPRSAAGVAAIYRLKGRPPERPLPVVAADVAQLAVLGVSPEDPLLALLADAWPAPLSLVVGAAPGLPAAAGGVTLAVRVPDHRPLCRLLAELGTPLTATSANRSGAPPALSAAAAAALVAGCDAAVVDGGTLAGGPPSTLVALAGGRLTVLRRGGYPMKALRRRAGGLAIDSAPGAGSDSR